jgi:hypothetical protein
VKAQAYGNELSVQAIAGPNVVLFSYDLPKGSIGQLLGFAINKTDTAGGQSSYLPNFLLLNANDQGARPAAPMSRSSRTPSTPAPRHKEESRAARRQLRRHRRRWLGQKHAVDQDQDCSQVHRPPRHTRGKRYLREDDSWARLFYVKDAPRTRGREFLRAPPR